MDNKNFEQFINRMAKGKNFSLFLMRHLPSAWACGVKLQSINENAARVSVREKWFTRNPFRSIYFAVLSMAAEASTGVLCMGMLYKETPCSMLIRGMSATFNKKARGVIVFTCSDGDKIHAAVQEAISKGDGVVVECVSSGHNDEGELVAEFRFTWSFKPKAFTSGLPA